MIINSIDWRGERRAELARDSKEQGDGRVTECVCVWVQREGRDEVCGKEGREEGRKSID
jgi:hypothetical protein